MAGKGRKRHFVYVVKDGCAVLYVGKGAGRRHLASARKHGGKAEIIEWCDSDDEAFDRERHWIAELKPTENKCKGGGGGRCRPKGKYDLPSDLKGRLTAAEWKQAVKEQEKQCAEIERLGARKYTARTLCERLNEQNCEQWGVSTVDLNRLREVAYG